jgi:YggT family protein
MDIICTLLQVYLIIIVVRIILSWIPTSEGTFGDKVRHAVTLVTDPVLLPLRSALPPVRMGAVALDLSPIIVVFALQIAILYLC